MMPPISPLLTDLYELNMIQAYLDRGDDGEAVFEFFVRRLPPRRGFLLAAGLDDALDYLETLRFSAAEIDWLKSTGRFRKNLLDYLAGFRFTGDVHAMPEGTICFPNEPLIRITAPLPQAQLVEIAADQHSAFPDADRVESRAHGAGGAGKNPVRFRPAHRARRRSRALFGARQLHRGLCRRGQRAGRRTLWHADRRHHGALLRAGARRRDDRVREFRARAARGRRSC